MAAQRAQRAHCSTTPPPRYAAAHLPISALLCLSPNSTTQDLDAENSDLKDKIAELEAAQCDDLQKQVDDLTSQLSDAKDELTTAQDDLATCTDAKDQICTAVNNGDDTSELCPVDPTNKMAKPATAGR